MAPPAHAQDIEEAMLRGEPVHILLRETGDGKTKGSQELEEVLL
jgi:hypothetical protein